MSRSLIYFLQQQRNEGRLPLSTKKWDSLFIIMVDCALDEHIHQPRIKIYGYTI